jgi:hypothetical protein
MQMRCHDNMSVLYIPHQKNSFAIYMWRTHNRWQITLIAVVSSSGMTYANVISVPTEEHNRYMTYITTYPPNGTHAFNVAWIALHTLQEHIQVLRKWAQDISTRPRYAVMTSRTTDMQPLPHDRDCPQASLILRGRVQDSHHPTGGNLPSYLFIGASLQKRKL